MATGYEECSSGLLFGQYCLASSSVINSKTECTLASFTDDNTLWGAVDMLEGRAAIQGHLKKLKEWANMNLMKLKDNANSGRNTPYKNTGWEPFDQKSTLQKGNWGVKFKYVPVAKKVKHLLVCISKNVASGPRKAAQHLRGYTWSTVSSFWHTNMREINKFLRVQKKGPNTVRSWSKWYRRGWRNSI